VRVLRYAGIWKLHIPLPDHKGRVHSGNTRLYPIVGMMVGSP